MFVSETKIYYCKPRTHFATYAHHYGIGGWMHWVDVKYDLFLVVSD